MSDARDILNKRLASGEIDEEEHQRLLDRLGQQAETPTTASEDAEPIEWPKGSFIWGIAGLLVAFFLYNYFSDMATNAINACLERGNPYNFCEENGVKWPMIYVMYGLAGFCFIIGILNLILPKKQPGA